MKPERWQKIEQLYDTILKLEPNQVLQLQKGVRVNSLQMDDGSPIFLPKRQTGDHVQSFPPSERKWQASSRWGTLQRWRRDRKELFYLALDGKLTATEVRVGATFQTGVPRALFEVEFISGGHISAVTADGRRFVLIMRVGEAPRPSITLVLNWTAELHR